MASTINPASYGNYFYAPIDQPADTTTIDQPMSTTTMGTRALLEANERDLRDRLHAYEESLRLSRRNSYTSNLIDEMAFSLNSHGDITMTSMGAPTPKKKKESVKEMNERNIKELEKKHAAKRNKKESN
jgi:hypothetical protein